MRNSVSRTVRMVVVGLVAVCILVVATAGNASTSSSLLDSRLFSTDAPSDYLSDMAAVVSQKMGIPVYVETRYDLTETPKSLRVPLPIGEVTMRSALETFVSGRQGLLWHYEDSPASIRILMASVQNDPTWTLNLHCPAFEVEDVLASEAVKILSIRVFPKGDHVIRSGGMGSFISRPGEDIMQHPTVRFVGKRITLSVKEGTVRCAFDQIAAAIGHARWTYSERGETRIVSFDPIDPSTYPHAPRNLASTP